MSLIGIRHKLLKSEYFTHKKFDILYEKTEPPYSWYFTQDILPVDYGYVPIGICVIATNELRNLEPARFIGLKYPRAANLNQPFVINPGNACGEYGFSNVDINGLSLKATLAEAQNDFDGENNTRFLLQATDASINIDTIQSTPSTSNPNHSPAAIGAYRYKTLSTNVGDWYLPALGECVFIKQNQTKINTILSNLNSLYAQNSISQIFTNSWVYWSSTRCTLTTSWRYDMSGANPVYNNIGVNNPRRVLVMIKI